jgi:hypothetical protein
MQGEERSSATGPEGPNASLLAFVVVATAWCPITCVVAAVTKEVRDLENKKKSTPCDGKTATHSRDSKKA